MAAQETPGGEEQPDSTGKPAPFTGSADWMGMASVGFEFVIAVLVPGAIGWWLDGKFGCRPWIMLVGGVLGFIAGLRILMRSVSSGTKR